MVSTHNVVCTAKSLLANDAITVVNKRDLYRNSFALGPSAMGAGPRCQLPAVKIFFQKAPLHFDSRQESMDGRPAKRNDALPAASVPSDWLVDRSCTCQRARWTIARVKQHRRESQSGESKYDHR